jgi:arachidonate 5-lipoxygenase
MWTNSDVKNAETYEKKYEAMFTKSTIWGWLPNPFNFVPKPIHVIDNWDDDAEFARQFMNGVNPLMLSVVKDPEKQLTKNLIDFFQDPDKDVDLQALTNAKRLFYVSYHDLVELKVNPHQAYPSPPNFGVPLTEPRYFDAPVIVFELSPNRQQLKILAIQLDRACNADVYSKQTTNEHTWRMAKSSVANADSQMHEVCFQSLQGITCTSLLLTSRSLSQWVSHLGKTHLTIEPMLVAIHNTLRKKKHKIYPFLKPMMRDTLFLNCQLHMLSYFLFWMHVVWCSSHMNAPCVSYRGRPTYSAHFQRKQYWRLQYQRRCGSMYAIDREILVSI